MLRIVNPKIPLAKSSAPLRASRPARRSAPCVRLACAAVPREQATLTPVPSGAPRCRKTAKGKRYNASYGNARSHATTKVAGTAAAPAVKKTAAKAPAKKVVAKKAS